MVSEMFSNDDVVVGGEAGAAAAGEDSQLG